MSSGISFTCDSCGREVFSCNIVNGMKFCVKCYQETFGDKDKQIAELQKQLVEIVKKIRKFGEKHYNWVRDGTGYDEQDYHESIGFNKAIDQVNEILDTILKKYQK